MNAKHRAILAVLAVLALLGVTPTTQAQSVRVTLTITRVRQIDNVDDTRPGEFYAKVRIGPRAFSKTGHREKAQCAILYEASVRRVTGSRTG